MNIHPLLYIMAVVAAACLIAVLSTPSDTCVVLYGEEGRWAPFLQGLKEVLPSVTAVHIKDPELDHIAYVDALQDLCSQYPRIICQIPNKRASRVLRNYRGDAVSIGSDPALAQPSVVCNIVPSEQSLVNAMMKHVPDVPGRKLLISASTCRLPKGWTQVQSADDAVGVTNRLSSMELRVIMVSNARLSTATTITALGAGNPRSQVLAATPGPEELPGLLCQVCSNQRGEGRLAGCMVVLGRRYRGQQTVVVDPVTVRPEKRLDTCPATSLRVLQSLRSVV